jgi:hypothetical protein
MSDQSFETEPHGFRIGPCATGFLRVAQGGLINVERLLHTSKITISIHPYLPYRIRLFSVKFEPLNNNPPGMDAASEQPAAGSIFSALQEQLGLHLKVSKGPVEALVIDSAAKPGGQLNGRAAGVSEISGRRHHLR